MVVPPVANPLQQASSIPVGIPLPPPPPGLGSVVGAVHGADQLSSTVTSSTSLLNASTVAGSMITSPKILSGNSLNTESPSNTKNDTPGLSLLPNQSSTTSNQNANHFESASASEAVLPTTTTNSASNLHPSVILQTQPSLFQAPPLNVPPPSVISCQRPPPPLPWLSAPPPPIMPITQGTLPLNFRPPLEGLVKSMNDNRSIVNNRSLPDSRQLRDNRSNVESRNLEDDRNSSVKRSDNHGPQSALDEGLNMTRSGNFRERLPPRLHSDEMESPQGRNINSDRNRERFRDPMINRDDLYGQSVYELKGMDRGPGLRPHMSNNPRMPILSRGFENSPHVPHPPNPPIIHGSGERFHFERRFNRGDWRMQGPGGSLPPPPMHLEDNMRIRPPNAAHHQSKDRNRRGDQWRDNKGNRNDKFGGPNAGGGNGGGGGGGGEGRGHFNRNRDRGQRNDRQGKWKSPNKDRFGGFAGASDSRSFSNQSELYLGVSDSNQFPGTNVDESVKTADMEDNVNVNINQKSTKAAEEGSTFNDDNNGDQGDIKDSNNNNDNNNDSNQNYDQVGRQNMTQEDQETLVT